MEVYHEITADAYVVILAGTIDGSNAGELEIAFHKALKSHKDKIIVNCRNLNFISSAGIGVLISSLPHVREKNIALTFEGMNAKVRHVFKVLGLDALLTISDSRLVA